MTPLLDPVLYESVAEQQRVLRETAARAHGADARGASWWRLLLGVSGPVPMRALSSVGWRRPGCSRRLACRHAPATR